MERKVTKWLTVGLAAVGVLTQVGVLPPVALDVLRLVGHVLVGA